jgi:hypothetical protein
MRPAHVAAAAALALSATVLPAVSTSVAADPPTVSGREAAADRALRHADAVLDGVGRRHDATLALRDLAEALPSLGPAERRRATALLARPTDPRDHFGDTYRAPAKRACSPHICMHWVNRTSDAPPSRAWVRRTMDVMKQTWAHEVGTMNYRRPLRDGQRGGDGRLDVYLKDVGAQGLFGYCATERKATKWTASGYCVLDDDFARSQFHAPPSTSMKATAAHEFFHEVQFAYDFAEDAWWMEATATWMEEQVFDGANDNRRYIPFGQVGEPTTPLDEFQPSGAAQYGNWPFFEYLSRHFGDEIVRTAWQTAAAVGDSRGGYSTQAIAASLPATMTLPEVFRDYTAANTDPSAFYPEGDHWNPAPPARKHELSRADPSAGSFFGKVDHLSSRTVRLVPRAGLGDPNSQLEVTVAGPAGRTSPVANLVIRMTNGDVKQRPIALKGGTGARTIPFDNVTVRRATLVLANASTRFDCRHGTFYSCRGIALDDDQRFNYTVTALPG